MMGSGAARSMQASYQFIIVAMILAASGITGLVVNAAHSHPRLLTKPHN